MVTPEAPLIYAPDPWGEHPPDIYRMRCRVQYVGGSVRYRIWYAGLIDKPDPLTFANSGTLWVPFGRDSMAGVSARLDCLIDRVDNLTANLERIAAALEAKELPKGKAS